MILRRKNTSKIIRTLTGTLMFLLISCLFIAMVPLRVHATTGSDWSGDNRYRVKVYWHVENAYDVEDNFCNLYYYDADSEISRYTGELNQVEDIYKGDREGHKSLSTPYTCDTKGNHSAIIETPGAPLGFYYQISGYGGNNCRYYVDKIEVEVIDPVDGTGIPTRTLWKGTIGARNGEVGGAINYCRLWFDTDPPEFTGWGNSSCTDKTTHTESYDPDFCQHPYIAGITPITVDEELNVPADNNEVSVELNAGVLYDNLGARWPLQKFDITTDHEDKNIKVEHRDGKWYLVLNPDSNAALDYTVTINQHVHEGEDHPASTSVTVHTFDYNFTFVDENGNVISEQTIDYGCPCTLPEYPEGCSARYECEQTAEWEDTTKGPQDRIVKVFYVTENLVGSGTKEDPYLIRNSSDWECMRRKTAAGETGKYYRLENNIHVVSMIGTQDQPFTGTFDGNGKTLDISYTNSNDAIDAPFAYVRNAAISNLTVTGSITGTGNCAAGLIGYNSVSSDGESGKGTIITNCTVYADISGNKEVGGFAIGRYGRLTIHRSSYKGSISGQLYAAGFVGYGTEETYLSNCLFDPESVDTSNPGGAACFAVGKYGTLRNCVYTEVFGTAQGQANTDYKFIFRNSEGKKIDEQMVHEGEQPLVPVSDGDKKIASWKCVECDDWTDTTNGVLKRNVIATLSSEPAFRGSGTESKPYEIYNTDDWHSLKLRVSNYDTAGEYYRLECDIDVNEIIGSEDKPFSGNFSGEMNTINVSLLNDDDYERTAPFSFVKDASFKYVHVTGSVAGDADRASGLIGDNYGTTTISDSIVSADISGYKIIGGFCIQNFNDLTITDSTFNGKMNVDSGAGFVGFDTGNYGFGVSDSAHFNRCLFDPKEGSSYERGDAFAFHSDADCRICLCTEKWTDDYYASFRSHGEIFESKYLEGYGTESEPYKLYGHGAYGWEALRLFTERESTKGVYFIQDSYMQAFSTVGDSDDHCFEGNFDGNGNILKVCYDDVDGRIEAPFSCVNSATISRATLMGTINGGRCAGLVGDSWGITVIEFCDIYTDITGHTNVGGFVSRANNILSIDSCTFEGTINGGEHCGGFVGSGSANTRLDNCYFTPSGTSTCITGATFVDMLYGEITNCYYTVAFGIAQGEQLNRGSGYTPENDNKTAQAAATIAETKVSKVKAKAEKGRKVVITWKKNNNIDGYQIRYSTNKKFKKSVKKVEVKVSATGKQTIRKLKAGKTYYVQIRTFKRVVNPATGKAEIVYGKWSKTAKFKAKK